MPVLSLSLQFILFRRNLVHGLLIRYRNICATRLKFKYLIIFPFIVFEQCLKLLLSCHGLDIITVEGIKSLKYGYNPIQERLNLFNGSQCGYCSPGMVMNMYSLLAGASGQVSSLEVEQAFGGNLCRCTGYRSILDAFKSVGEEASFEDIEDLGRCNKMGRNCTNAYGICKEVKCDQGQSTLKLRFSDDHCWYKVYSIQALMEVLNCDIQQPYMLVAGCTAHGILKTHKLLTNPAK